MTPSFYYLNKFLLHNRVTLRFLFSCLLQVIQKFLTYDNTDEGSGAKTLMKCWSVTQARREMQTYRRNSDLGREETCQKLQTLYRIIIWESFAKDEIASRRKFCVTKTSWLHYRHESKVRLSINIVHRPRIFLKFYKLFIIIFNENMVRYLFKI